MITRVPTARDDREDPGPSARCPVCPYEGLKESDLGCPSCGTDLTALRRVQELPLALLSDALDLLRQGRNAEAILPAEAAAAFPSARPRALLALGDAWARLGDDESASRYWREAATQGMTPEANTRLGYVADLKARAEVDRTARRASCPTAGCPDLGRKGRGNIALARMYGRAQVPLWRCRSCGSTFSGNRDHLLFRSRVSPAKAYEVMAGLLDGRSPAEVAAQTSCSPATVRRLGVRAFALGPQVVDEVAAGLHTPAAKLRRRWTAFARRSWELS